MNDYERIARVIRHLDEHRTEQPNLAPLADLVGLSPFHFHRLFTAWAGVTPKTFLQHLTMAHARERLRRSESVLDVAFEVGLSGPGRLHDLAVTVEAASPGELKHGGRGWTITAGFAESPFGRCLMGDGPRGISHLSFVEPGEEERALAELQVEWPGARLKRDDSLAVKLATRVFRGASGTEASASRPRLRAFARGSAFQARVWKALLRIPPGALVTYGQLASAMGAPSSARAVGTAVGRSTLAYLIPCHRVIRQTGVLGDYRWGITRKKAMLGWEEARESPPQTTHASGPRTNTASGQTYRKRSSKSGVQHQIPA